VPATEQQLLALGIPQASIDAGEHRFDLDQSFPWGTIRRVRGIVECAEFGEWSSKKWVEFYPVRTMVDCREAGYHMEGRVSVGGKKRSCFTSDILFELPDRRLIKVAVIFARMPKAKITEAKQFLVNLGTVDTSALDHALVQAARKGDVSENQDWSNGKSTWTFSDDSTITMEGDVVTLSTS
jgi:hypothetical protein